MAKKEKRARKQSCYRPPRLKLTAEEILKRMQDIDKRKDAMIAAVRNRKGQ